MNLQRSWLIDQELDTGRVQSMVMKCEKSRDTNDDVEDLCDKPRTQLSRELQRGYSLTQLLKSLTNIGLNHSLCMLEFFVAQVNLLPGLRGRSGFYKTLLKVLQHTKADTTILWKGNLLYYSDC